MLGAIYFAQDVGYSSPSSGVCTCDTANHVDWCTCNRRGYHPNQDLKSLLRKGKKCLTRLLKKIVPGRATSIDEKRGTEKRMSEDRAYEAMPLSLSSDATANGKDRKVRFLIGSDDVEGLTFTADTEDRHEAERAKGRADDRPSPQVHKMERFMGGG